MALALRGGSVSGSPLPEGSGSRTPQAPALAPGEEVFGEGGRGRRAGVRGRIGAGVTTAPKSSSILEAGPSGGQSGGYASGSQCVRTNRADALRHANLGGRRDARDEAGEGRAPCGPERERSPGRRGGHRAFAAQRPRVAGRCLRDCATGRTGPFPVRHAQPRTEATAKLGGRAREGRRGRGRSWALARGRSVRRPGGGARRLAASARGGPRRRARRRTRPTRARRGRSSARARGRRGR